MFTPISYPHRALRLGLILCGWAWLAASQAGAADLARHQKLAQDVLDQLLTVVDRPDEGWDTWPPTIVVLDIAAPNAKAGPRMVDGKRMPYIEVHRGEIERVAEFDPDTLALTIGHELGHLVLHHSLRTMQVIDRLGDQDIPFVVLAVGRDHELEADEYGLKIALEAGFNAEKLYKNLVNSHREYGQYCAYDGLSASHPAWEERCAILHEGQQQFWRSMAAFRRGVFLLQGERFVEAQACFRSVTKAFPKCHEAWANLGYALLMQYCDDLDIEDLRELDIGHLVVGGFYERPQSLEEMERGGLVETWLEAVDAMRQALTLKPDLLLVKANLAVAYLVSPEGKDVGEAEKLFTEVLDGLAKGKGSSINPALRLAILINATAGRADADQALLERAQREMAQMQEKWRKTSEAKMLTAALSMNRARSLVATPDKADDQEALKLYEQYLGTVSRNSSWWSLAYEQYARLCKSLGQPVKEADELRGAAEGRWRPTIALDLPDGGSLALAAPVAQIAAVLGEPQQVTDVIQGTSLKMHCYDDRGVYVLATGEVLAVFLRGNQAPPLRLHERGLSGQESVLAIGMSQADLEALLGDEWAGEPAFLYDPEVTYRFYPAAGVAVRFEKGKVQELVVVIVPRGGAK